MKVNVRRSTVIDAPVAQVWEILRDYNGHDRWHPAVVDSILEDNHTTDMIGAVRSFHLTGGEHLREQLLSMSDHDFSFSYCIVQSPIPLDEYVAHVRLVPITDGNATFWEWHSSFVAPDGREAELGELVGDGVYRAGFEAIRALLGGARPATVSEALTPNRTIEHPPITELPTHSPVSSPKPEPLRAAISSSRHDIEAAAIILSQHGGPETLVSRSIFVPTPNGDEVRIQHRAIGVNYIDVYCRTGLFDLIDLPGIPGLEASGVVIDVGPSVSRFKPGDRVAYACVPPGAYCSARNLHSDRLVKLPDGITDEIAAASLVKGLTAEFLLHRVHRLERGETVLVHAAAGGVGSLLTQWANALGAHVIGTVGSADKAALATGNGCAAVINYREQNFVTEVARLTDGRGVDLVVDGVGQETFAGSAESLADCGHLISYGQASGLIGQWDIDAMAGKSMTISRPNFGHYTDTRSKLEAGSERLFAAIAQGIVQPQIGRQFPLSDAADAHRWLESRQSTGSNLLLP